MKNPSKSGIAVVVSLIAAFLLLFAAGCSSGGSSFKYRDTDDENTVYTEEPEQTVEYKTAFENKVSYVMIYNPYIYSEDTFTDEKDKNEIYTGDFASQINSNLTRAVGLDEEDDLAYLTPSDIGPDLSELDINFEGNKASPLQETFEEGETCEFWCGSSSRSKKTFTCVYAGEHCYVWEYNSGLTDSDLQSYGRGFDSNIYDTDVELFGEPRYADAGGKINILFYPMDDIGSGTVFGFFLPAEIFTSEEVSNYIAEQKGINLNKAIINMNSTCVQVYERIGETDSIYSTMAHELQHLICTTDWIESASGMYANHCATWLNEAMSGFVEEYLYPGIKSTEHGHIKQFMLSDSVRNGQSLYNFDTTNDIGVYGQVYLFSEYVANLVDNYVFKSIHSGWRNNRSGNATEAQVLYNTLPESEQRRIRNSIQYPSSVNFSNDYDEWYSKMTLDFYLSMLTYEADDPNAYNNVDPMSLLYNQNTAANIEGGGRVIVATNEGTFSIPDDAGDGLIYIGLDENFNPTGEIIGR